MVIGKASKGDLECFIDVQMKLANAFLKNNERERARNAYKGALDIVQEDTR